MDLCQSAIVEAWRCKRRGLCCRQQRVTIDEVERRRIGRHLIEAADARALALAPDRIERLGGYAVLPRVDDRCAFLDDDALCGLRKRFGERAYPDVCRKFPYLAIHAGDRLVVDLSFHCPTALELLARSERFSWTTTPEGEPPVDRFALLGGDGEALGMEGEALGVAAFWQRHWALCAALEARTEVDPGQRLRAFAEALTGGAIEPARLTRAQLAHGAFDATLAAELARVAGEVPEDLEVLWMHVPPQPYTLDELPPIDTAALVTRYLLHRAYCPTYYLVARDHRLFLTALFALVARHRIELAQGGEPLDAVRQTDRFLVHGGNIGALHASGSTFAPWRAMASLACAELVD